MNRLTLHARHALRRTFPHPTPRSLSLHARPSATSTSTPAPDTDTSATRPDEAPEATDASAEQTHFGFRSVPLSSKQSLVGAVFETVAPSYDLMNDVMSAGVHRLWKSAFVADLAPTPDMTVLDCAGGTGDIAFRILDHMRPSAAAAPAEPRVTVADINDAMLAVGRARADATARNAHVRFVTANAEELPFDDASFDAYTISFGMRNVPRPAHALREAMRVLRPGGRFMMLEFGRVDNASLGALYDAYSFRVIPALGQAFAGDADAYRYLVESIRQFPAQDEFLDMVREAGFVRESVTDYSMGIAACYSGFKPVR